MFSGPDSRFSGPNDSLFLLDFKRKSRRILLPKSGLELKMNGMLVKEKAGKIRWLDLAAN